LYNLIRHQLADRRVGHGTVPCGRVRRTEAADLEIGMKRLFALAGVLTLAALMAPQPASAQYSLRTTDDLAKLCDTEREPNSDAALASCEGFIVGSGMLYMELVQSKAIEPWACAEEPLPSLEEVRMQFLEWVASHPERAGSRAVDGFWEAMSAAYPCS
jgi:hypothetical protein